MRPAIRWPVSRVVTTTRTPRALRRSAKGSGVRTSTRSLAEPCQRARKYVGRSRLGSVSYHRHAPPVDVVAAESLTSHTRPAGPPTVAFAVTRAWVEYVHGSLPADRRHGRAEAAGRNPRSVIPGLGEMRKRASYWSRPTLRRRACLYATHCPTALRRWSWTSRPDSRGSLNSRTTTVRPVTSSCGSTGARTSTGRLRARRQRARK